MKYLLAGLCALTFFANGNAQEGAQEKAQEVTAAAATSANPAGKWAWTQDMRGNEVSFELVLAMKDDKLTGTFQSIFPNPPEGFPADMAKPVDIEDGKVEGDKISFNVVRDFNGNEFVSKFEGTVKGDQIVGSRTVNFGGEDRVSDWTAKRSGLMASDVVGDWVIKVNTPQGEIEEKLSFEMDGDKLKGVFHSSFFGDSPLKDIKLEGEKLLFGVEFSNNEFSMDIDYETKPKGDKITGAAKFEMNGQETSIDIEGTKAGAKADAAKPAE